MKLPVKLLDVLIILLAIGAAVFSSYNAYIKPQGEALVLIQGQGSEWIFDIGASETVIVAGPLGDTTVRIKNNNAWVEESPCGNKTCVASGFVKRQGQWAACLPNNVLLIIQGKGEGDYDAHAW